jgi:hypothetical protein
MLPAGEPLRFTEGVGNFVRTFEKERALIVDGIDRDWAEKLSSLEAATSSSFFLCTSKK